MPFPQSEPRWCGASSPPANGLRAAGFVDSQALSFAFANSAGHRAQGRTTRATIDGIQQTDTSAGSAHQTSLGIADLDAATAGGIAAELAQRSAAFVDLEPGRYEVVLSPECVATIAVFLAVYGFNAQAHLDGSSFVDLDETQFSPLLTIVDDPLRPDAIGLGFDVEGTPKRPLTLVEQGVTRSLVHDRRTAHRAGATSTGHALGASGFGPVPANIVVTPGSATADELVAWGGEGAAHHRVQLLPDPRPPDPGGDRAHPQRDFSHRGRHHRRRSGKPALHPVLPRGALRGEPHRGGW